MSRLTKKKLRFAQFFETALRAVLIHSLIRINSPSVSALEIHMTRLALEFHNSPIPQKICTPGALISGVSCWVYRASLVVCDAWMHRVSIVGCVCWVHRAPSVSVPRVCWAQPIVVLTPISDFLSALGVSHLFFNCVYFTPSQ